MVDYRRRVSDLHARAATLMTASAVATGGAGTSAVAAGAPTSPAPPHGGRAHWSSTGYAEGVDARLAVPEAEVAAIAAARAVGLRDIRDMREYCAALAAEGARMLVTLWGTSTLISEPSIATPFLIPVETPLDFRTFLAALTPGGAPSTHTLPGTGSASPGQAFRVIPGMTLATDLTQAQAQHLASLDGGINEGVAGEIFGECGIQGQFFYLVSGGVGRIYCRISAQVYNTLDDYRALGLAVLRLAERKGTLRQGATRASLAELHRVQGGAATPCDDDELDAGACKRRAASGSRRDDDSDGSEGR